MGTVVSKVGEGALSLIGLMSSGPGGVGEPGESLNTGRSKVFHFVDSADVSMADGQGGRCLPEGVKVGVLWIGCLKVWL